MFGSKREKALEEELAAAQREIERRGRLLEEIVGQKEDITEQFVRMAASYAQVTKDMERLREQMQEVHGLAESSVATAADIRNAIVEVNNGMSTFDANHSVFMGAVKRQDEKIMDIVESNKHFTTPMKYISEFSTVLKGERDGYQERLGRMLELSKRMSVMALNAAIEAGRIGESGGQFVAAAEEIRVFCENYEREAREFIEELASSKTRAAEFGEQAQHLNGLLKENNISMGRLYRDAAQNMAAYEGQQMDLRGLVSETYVGRADALQQSQQECMKAQERMLGRMDELEVELKEYKNCVDELETICKGLQTSAEQINEKKE